MGELEESLIAWVKIIQINNCELSSRIKSLKDLWDGVLLYELMAEM
jgi:hypothetical protein